MQHRRLTLTVVAVVAAGAVLGACGAASAQQRIRLNIGIPVKPPFMSILTPTRFYPTSMD